MLELNKFALLFISNRWTLGWIKFRRIIFGRLAKNWNDEKWQWKTHVWWKIKAGEENTFCVTRLCCKIEWGGSNIQFAVFTRWKSVRWEWRVVRIFSFNTSPRPFLNICILEPIVRYKLYIVHTSVQIRVAIPTISSDKKILSKKKKKLEK